MDEAVMITWVDNVLKVYVTNALDHVIPLLILDSYHCHMMALVVTRIQELGIEVKHVPGRFYLGIGRPYLLFNEYPASSCAFLFLT